MRIGPAIARRRWARDDGVTLVEVLVAIIVIGIVSALVVGAVSQLGRVFIHNDDENRGLQDSKIVMERLGRDVREARAVTCDDPVGQTSPPRCADHLQVWVDANSDYVEQASEVITWKVVPSADGEHYDVLRVTGSGVSATTKTEATSLIVGAIFTYNTPKPEDATLVNIDLTYDALVGVGTQLRHAEFSARLRNR